MGQSCTQPLFSRAIRPARARPPLPRPADARVASRASAREREAASSGVEEPGQENEDPNRLLDPQESKRPTKPKRARDKAPDAGPADLESVRQLQEVLPGVSAQRAAAALAAADHDVEGAALLLMSDEPPGRGAPAALFRLEDLPELLVASRELARGGAVERNALDRLTAAVQVAGSLEQGFLHTLAVCVANAALDAQGRAALVEADVATHLWAVGVGATRAATAAECFRGLANLLSGGEEVAAYADELSASGLLAALAAVPIYHEHVAVERLACLANLALVRPRSAARALGPGEPHLPSARDLLPDARHVVGAELRLERARQQLRLVANLVAEPGAMDGVAAEAFCARLAVCIALAPDALRVLALRSVAALTVHAPTAAWTAALGSEHLRELVAPLAAGAAPDLQLAARRALVALTRVDGKRGCALTPEPALRIRV